MIKTNLKLVFDELKRTDISIEQIYVEGELFTVEQLKKLHEWVDKNKELYINILIKYKYFTSRRIALIVLLEEDFFDKNNYDFEDLTKYERKASIRFEVTNKNKKDLDTPEKVHPKNPCLYYENFESNQSKRQYREALKKLLETPFHFFEKEEAIKSLSNTFEDLQNC